MSGEDLKERLTKNGYQMKDVADLMGMSQQNFSTGLKVADVKTGFIEKLCVVLGKKMDFFYAGTEYAPSAEAATSVNEEISILKGQIMAYQDALDRIGRGDMLFKKANVG